jgi:membrane protein
MVAARVEVARSRLWDLVKVLVDAGKKFAQDDGLLMAGALAFFTTLSLAPLLLVLTGVASLLVDEGPLRQRLLAVIGNAVGPDGRSVAETVLDRVTAPHGGVTSIVVGVVAVVFGATSSFAHLQTALNRVWGVRKQARHHLVRKRLLSLLLVIVLFLLLLASMVLSTVVRGAHAWLAHHSELVARHPWLDLPWTAFDWTASIVTIALLVGVVFKVLPDVRLAWRDVSRGAVVTTGLLIGGRYLIALYLGRKGLASTYGAAGSFAVLLAFLYYSAVVLLYGAALTQVLAVRAGRAPTPRRGAELTHRPVAAPAGR